MNRKPLLAISITILLFSTIEVAIKAMGSARIDPYLLAVLRFGIAGIVMVLVSLKAITQVSMQDWFRLIAVGALGLGGTFGPYHAILENADASKVALIFSMNPIFASLFAIPFLKEPLQRRHIVALIVGFIGVYVVQFGNSAIQFSSLKEPLLMLWTAVAFGAYTTYNKKMVRSYGPLFSTGVGFISAALVLLPFVQNFAIPSTIPVILTVNYLIFGTTLLGYSFYFYGLRHVSIVAGSSLFYLKPIIATILAICILQEQPTAGFYGGMILIFIALWITLKPRKSTNETC